MKVTQISGLMNETFGEILGEDNLLTEDLSNVVNAGQILIASDGNTGVFGKNFDNYAGTIIDKVGRTMFWDRVYIADDLGIWRDSFEYGSVLEKIRCEMGKTEDNGEWELVDSDGNGLSDYNEGILEHIKDLFKFHPVGTQAKYFNGKTTFRTAVSITRKQLREAFRSASDLVRFVAMIENQITSELEMRKNKLQKMVIANNMAYHIAKNKQIVDLKEMYTAEVGGTVPDTLQKALGDARATRFIGQKMAWFREMMKEPSKLYSATGVFFNHTPIEYSRLLVLADLDSALRFNVYGDTYNDEFVKLDNYKTVPYWQTPGDTFNALSARSGVNVIGTYQDTDLSIKTFSVERNAVIGVLFDRDGIMICNEDPEVRNQYNADGNFTNYLYCSDCSYYNDYDENCIVFVWGAGNAFRPAIEEGTAKSGKTKVSSTSGAPTPGTGEALYGLVTNKPLSFEPGEKITVSDWTAVTAGTTQFSATAGQYMNLVVANSTSGVVSAYGATKITASAIG